MQERGFREPPGTFPSHDRRYDWCHGGQRREHKVEGENVRLKIGHTIADTTGATVDNPVNTRSKEKT